MEELMKDKILKLIRDEIETYVEEVYEPYDEKKLGEHVIFTIMQISGMFTVYDSLLSVCKDYNLKEELAEDENRSCKN